MSNGGGDSQSADDEFCYNGVPETDASWPSRLVFSWMTPMFRRAAVLRSQGKALQQQDLLPLPWMDHGSVIRQTFEEAWKTHSVRENESTNETSKPESSSWKSTSTLRKSLWAVIGKPVLAAGVIKIVNTGLQFAFPLLLRAILEFIEDVQQNENAENESSFEQHRGYYLAVFMFFAMATKAMTDSLYFQIVHRAGFQARVAVTQAVYGKALRLSSSERQGITLGEVVNLMQVDATKIELLIPQLHLLWDGLLQICGYMTLLYTLIGWPCFAGLLVLICTAPIQTKLMQKQFGLNRKMAKHTDDRVKATNEALQSIRCVKMYAWEECFHQSIQSCRDLELSKIRRTLYLKGYSRACMEALPGIVAVTSFVVYALAKSDAVISASILFTALAAFDQLRFPLLLYPMALAQLAQASVSAVRVETFLKFRDVETSKKVNCGSMYCRNDANHKDGQVIVNKATIYWQDPYGPIEKKNQEREDGMKNYISKLSDDGDKTDSSTISEETRGSECSKPILPNINLKVDPGVLCAVVGRVGCGKSTLCNAILNETVLTSGNIALSGTIAYAAQTPWILNSSLRDNILFGLPYNKEKYDRVLEACQLTHDLRLLTNGDLTEIGERGINLSGGQKQRVSVARAAYSEADVIILDDPLSALDPEVGMKLFNECIVKLMKGRTRVLVTNALQHLRFCDTIVALGDGEVLEQGTYAHLKSTEGGEIQRLLQELKSASGNNQSGIDDKDSKTDSVDGQDGGADKDSPDKQNVQGTKDDRGGSSVTGNDTDDLVTKEERNIGAVSWSVYKAYIKSGGGFFSFAFVYLWYVLGGACNLANMVSVTLWTSDADYDRMPQGFYLGMYALTAIALGVFTYVRTRFHAQFGVIASRTLHENLLTSILHAPMSFFDTTPTGRVLSRFSKDMLSIDQELSVVFVYFLFAALTVVFALGAILFVTPWFGIVLIPIVFVYIRVLNYFREVSRETRRLDSISRSPVYAHFSETLGGLTEIRAYDQRERFIGNFEGIVDQNTRAYYCKKSADRWLAVRLEIIGATIAGFAAVLSVQVALSGTGSTVDSDNNFASLAGLSLTYAISATNLLQWCVRAFAQLEAAMNACERVLYYTQDIAQEAPSTSKAMEKHAASYSPPDPSDPSAFAVVAAGGKAVETTKDWPAKGAITLNNLRLRYRPETPLVLKGLNVSIAGGERVGVVGRTGSGKSSLLLCLLRMVEPNLMEQTELNNYQAPILIDGVDVLRVGLLELRSKMGIIPQNPVLFSGTIRSNIDPFDDYQDEQIWKALGQCDMKDAVMAMPDGLASPVAEYGENLSQGQRQLLCLGRALLKQSRLLLLDEATSSIDFETDRNIQRTLREAFKGITVLTVAHRVNTILDSDKILVMKDGLAEEFASPGELLENEDSIFAEIVRHAEAEQH